MIEPDRRYTLGITTHACANGETVETRLVLWDEDGKTITLASSYILPPNDIGYATYSLLKRMGHYP